MNPTINSFPKRGILYNYSTISKLENHFYYNTANHRPCLVFVRFNMFVFMSICTVLWNLIPCMFIWASLVAQMVKNPHSMQETQVWSLSQKILWRGDVCLENSMDREAWRATVHEITKSRTQLKWLGMHTFTELCANHWSVYFSYIILFNLHRVPEVGQLILISERGPQISKRLSNLPKIKELVSF